MPDCVFCMIADKKIPSQIVYEDEEILAFKDINPEAPVHILIIPKKHFTSLMELNEEDMPIISKIFDTAKKLAKDFGISESGFRIVNNYGSDGGQSVDHMHFHMMGGRLMHWPPG